VIPLPDAEKQKSMPGLFIGPLLLAGFPWFMLQPDRGGGRVWILVRKGSIT
jgi:hypothetical protein